ncbi:MULTISPECIES: hypothetical protein [Lysinibacillus]|uniref:Uncharacterized protein n=1 Tax=Lysinibacillus antri TaxID=2498145 RepID=A0A3S0PMS7_9BACI|nr:MULTISPECIES: hypothetical protein [Lysinibacillus]RUL49022.1 hypothetical protein EK386_16040 [Lysinibacillus antri]TSI04735.1 hypothetical protein FJQ64_13735 [Lysinibacillus sp. BW-2-10]
MCISSNFIELQAYNICEEIRKQSVYTLVRLEISEGWIIEPQNTQNYWDGKALITKVILEDTKGKSYIINPDANGLRFAKGEITYKEYRRIEKSENLKAISFFALLVGLTMTMMYILVKFLT